MDDANLSKLLVNQTGMQPEFNKNTLDYSLTVPNSVEILKVTAVPNDKGASCSIKSNSGFGEEVKLLEGENKIQIECTSEDGTIKKYSITCKRLSASNASLKNLKFNEFDIKFETDIFQYNILVDFSLTHASFELSSFDPSSEIQILLNNKTEPKSQTGSYKINLNYSLSLVLIKVTSSNKSTENVYTIKIIKRPFPRLCLFHDSKDDLEYLDFISLSPYYSPVSFNKNFANYSEPIITVLKQICSSENFSLLSTESDEFKINIDLENKLNDLKVKVPLLNGASTKDVSLRDIFSLVNDINLEEKLISIEEDIKNHKFSEIKDLPDSLEAYQAKPWEKQLQIIYEETESKVLHKNSQFNFEKYLTIVNSGVSKKILKSNNEEQESAIYFLNKSIYEAATAIKFSTKDYTLHFWLAQLLEEKHFFENIYGPELQEEKSANSLVLQNKLAEESSKEDEINAICKIRNISPTASNAEKLKALDMEYQHLKETNQHVKAEQIQGLYQYKAKKIINESKKDTVSSDNNNYVYQANMKYLDGLSIILNNKQENFNAYFVMGRSLFSIGDYKKALPYFKRCIHWSNTELQTLARFYFAFALSKQVDLVDSYIKVIFHFLLSGLQLYLFNLNKCLNTNDVSYSENYFSIFNVEFLEAFMIVGKLKKSYPNSLQTISAQDSFKYCAWLSSVALIELNKKSSIDKETFLNSKIIKEIINLLIESHYNLASIENLNGNDKTLTKKLRIKYFISLISLIRLLGNKESEYILKMQEEVSQELVFNKSNEFYFLLLLGCSKLELYDLLNDNKLESDENYLSELLNESKDSLVVCNEIYEKKNQEEIPKIISEQKWWLKKIEEKQKQETKKTETVRPPSAKNDPKPSPAAKPIAKPLPASKKPAPAATPKSTPAAKPAANNTKNVSHTHGKSQKPEEPKQPEVIPAKTETAVEEPKQEEKIEIKINIDSKVLFTQSQLYSARVYSRLKQFDVAKKLYLKVIENEPKKQDAYIELANMLKKNNDIMGAVDVYSKYPLDFNKEIKSDSNSESFDDAFICGELVSLLISSQNYDDPRLVKYLVMWAKIYGISIIEKYINILDKANKTKACKEVYASVHKKSPDDPDLQQFFKLKGWL